MQNKLLTIFIIIIYGGNSTKEQKYNSGIGSTDTDTIEQYVSGLKNYFEPKKFNILDIGCGNFNVGIKTRDHFNEYIACDIVEDLIEYNKLKYHTSNVLFTKLNAINDILPDADIVILRQVLQHLSNAEIFSILKKLKKYKFIIITEHIPTLLNIVYNIDKLIGPDIRLSNNSGVSLSKLPFNLKFKKETQICNIMQSEGRVETIIYEL